MSGLYEPVFCPNCGTTVNDPEFLVDPLTASSGPARKPGPQANCGWCKQRHHIDGVPICRKQYGGTGLSGQITEERMIAGIIAKYEQQLADD